MPTVLILQDREAIDMDNMGNIVRKRQVTFQIDGHGPFTYEVPKDEWSLDAFKSYVRELMKEIEEMEKI